MFRNTTCHAVAGQGGTGPSHAMARAREVVKGTVSSCSQEGIILRVLVVIYGVCVCACVWVRGNRWISSTCLYMTIMFDLLYIWM